MAHGGPDVGRIARDAALMERVAAGDERAFRLVAEAEGPRVLRFATTVLGNVAEAEEVSQEALLRLWRHAPEWRPVARIATWLHQVAYRLALDLLRRRRPTVEIEGVAESVDPAPLPDEAVLRLRRARDLAAAIGELPERQRVAVVLAHHQGLSEREAASVMGVTEAAYHSLLARGRRSLRQAMGAWTREEPETSRKGGDGG
jgi:RNA polymerase sigma-70 factor, ECF subfamily